MRRLPEPNGAHDGERDRMKVTIGVLFSLLTLHPTGETIYITETIVRTVEVEREREPWPEPEQPDHMTDDEWAEFERQSECLWNLMRERGMEITLETVTAADVWAEHNGGACHLLGDNDESHE